MTRKAQRDAMTNAIMGDPESRSLLEESLVLFEKGKFDQARILLDRAYGKNFEDPEIRSALWVCGYWSSRVGRLDELGDEGAKGDFLLRHWRHFDAVSPSHLDAPFEEGLSRVKTWAFTEALACYERSSSGEEPDTESLLQSGRCRKALGRYTEAIETFEEALKTGRTSDARHLAELADSYALIGEDTAAKVMFREAFFVDPSKIDLELLESPLIQRLAERLEKEKNYRGSTLNEWLPVYGVLWGVFDVKRELRPVEYGKLKQSIYALKSEIADGDEEGRLKPRLINRYFWLIDHYQQIGEDRSTVEEALLSIKLLSPSVYKRYTE